MSIGEVFISRKSCEMCEKLKVKIHAVFHIFQSHPVHLIGVFDSSPYVWGPWSKLLDKKWYQWYWISIRLEPTPNIH